MNKFWNPYAVIDISEIIDTREEIRLYHFEALGYQNDMNVYVVKKFTTEWYCSNMATWRLFQKQQTA